MRCLWTSVQVESIAAVPPTRRVRKGAQFAVSLVLVQIKNTVKFSSTSKDPSESGGQTSNDDGFDDVRVQLTEWLWLNRVDSTVVTLSCLLTRGLYQFEMYQVIGWILSNKHQSTPQRKFFILFHLFRFLFTRCVYIFHSPSLFLSFVLNLCFFYSHHLPTLSLIFILYAAVCLFILTLFSESAMKFKMAITSLWKISLSHKFCLIKWRHLY